jgi:hypothetical protein
MVTTVNVLKKNLISLQQRGGVVASEMRRAHQNLHSHLSEIYFWWTKASKQGNYLEDEYNKLGKTFRTVSYGTNFAPVLWLVYGENNGLNNRHADRFSRALNAVHNEVSNKVAFYEKDGVTKLINFIQQSGGITTLAGYAPPEENSSTNPIASNKNIDDENKEIQELLNQSWMLNEFRIEKKSPVPYATYIKTTPENFAVLLVKRTDNGFEIIDVDNNTANVNHMLTNSLRKRFDLCVFSIRSMLELMYTQCLPQSLEGLAERLIDISELSDDKKIQKFVCHRRVFYRAETSEFILSPMNAASGVVSIVKPYFDLILDGCKTDVYVPYTERNNIEKTLLRNFDFNLYDTELKQLPIPEYPELNSASHVVHLRHRTQDNKFQNLSFWPFYSSLTQPQDQLLIRPEYVLTPSWYAHIDKDEIRRVNDEFVDKWLGGHARYLTREAHKILKVTFADTWWAIEFVNEDGVFVNKQNVHITPIEVSNQVVTALFRTKDLIPALICLADLPIIKVSEPESAEEHDFNVVDNDYRGSIRFDLDDNVLCIKFYTDGLGGAEHTIYVPTLDKQGNLSEIPFYLYHPSITIDAADSAQALAQLQDELPELVEIEQ